MVEPAKKEVAHATGGGVTVTRPQSPLKLSRRHQEPQMLGLELSELVAWLCWPRSGLILPRGLYSFLEGNTYSVPFYTENK